MRNHLREKLRANRPTYGLWVTLESPTISEIAAALALDWVCIDMEHGHLGFREAIEHLRALHGSEVTPLVRVPEIGQSAIKRALDIGAHGLLLPLPRGREDVAQGMRLGRYPPQGVRGVGGERAVQWGLGFEEYLACANEETLLIPIIETREAAEEIDSILDVPGLEAIFFGPADLSASYGYLGEWEGPGIAQTILDIREKAEARGIASGVMARSVEEAARRGEQGFRLVGLGSDTGLLIRALNESLGRLRGPVTRPGYF